MFYTNNARRKTISTSLNALQVYIQSNQRSTTIVLSVFMHAKYATHV